MPSSFASPALQASTRVAQAPLWSDYLKTAGIGTTDLLAAVPAGTRYAAELTDTDLGESIASGSQYLQDVVHGWGEDLEAGLSEPARENLLAEFGSEAFWKHPFSSIALKATRTTPSMAATVAGTMLTGGGAPALAALAGIQGGLSATQTVDEMYRAIDSQSDADLRVNSKLYNQFRQDGLSEREARRQLNQVNIGAKPAVLFAVGAATSLFGPEAQVLRGLGAKGLGAAYSGGIARRTGKAMGAGAVSEAIETGAESLASEQGAVDVGFQSSINPYRVAAATAEGATLGALFGTVGGLKGPTRPPVRPTTNANTRPEPDNPPAAAIKPIVTPAPGPVSMPGKGSNTQATPPIVAGREGHTAATSRVATVPGAKGDAFKKSKGAKGKSNVVPLVLPAPATGTAATQTPTPAQVVAPAPQGDPGGLVTDSTQVAALAAQTAPTGIPAAPAPAPTPTPTPAPVAPVQAVSTALAPTQPVAPTGPAPTPSQTAPPPSVQTPGAGFGAGTAAVPVTQAVPTEGATPSAFGGVAQPVVAPTVQPTVQAPAPVVAEPVVTPVAPVTPKAPKAPKVIGDKNTQRTEARTRDAQVAQDFLNARPAEPVVPTTLPEVDAFVAGLKNTLEQVSALGVKFRKRVSGEKMPASIVWLRELETAYNKLKSGKLGAKATNKVISEFITREIQIKAGDVANVKATRIGEGTTAMAVPQGNVETIAAGPQQAATEEEAARRESEEVSLEEGVPEATIAGEEAAPDVGVSEEVTETVSEEGEVSHEKAEVKEVTEKPRAGQVSKDDVETKVSGSKAGRVKLGEDLVEREITLASGEKVKEQVPKAVTREVSAEARAEIMARYAGAKAEPKPEPEKLPSKVDEIKTKAADKKAAQEAKLPPKVKRKKLVTKEAPKPSGKAALADELAKVEPTPSQAQIDADNARKGHVSIEGVPVSISTAKNTERQGQTPFGRRWNWLYKFSYGQIPGTKGPDGTPIGIFLGPEAYPKNENLQNLPVVVIDQVDPVTKTPDEPKVMLGFKQITDAVKAYEESYPDGAARRGDVTIMSLDEFKTWLKTKSDAEPAGVPVSDVDVAVEEAVTEDISAGVSKAEIEAYLPKFAKHFTPKPTMEGRIAANRAKGAQDLKTIQDNTIAQNSLSSYMGKGLRAILNYFLAGRVNAKWRAIYPQFAKRVRAIAGDVQVYVIPDDVFSRISNPAFGAAYDPINDLIIVKESISKNTFYMARVVLHEGTHAAFWKTTHQHPELQQVLGNILFEARKAGLALTDPAQRAEFARHYGVSNIDELIAEAFSNERFQEFLASQPASAKLVTQLGLGKGPHSMWDVLVRLVGKILGLPNAHDSLLGAVLRVTERMESRAPDLTGPASDTAIKWRLGLQDLGHYSWTAPTEESLLSPLRLPDVFNKRLPSQVRQAPQQQQQGDPWFLPARTMDQLAQLAKGFGTNFYKHLRIAADTTEKIRVSADKYLNESMSIIRELHELERKYKGTGQWQAFTDLVYDETAVGVFADRPLAGQKHLGKNTLRGIYPKAKYAELNARWQTLPQDLKDARLKTMNFFTEQQNLEKIGIIRNTLKVAGFPDPDLAQRLFDGDETDVDIALLGRTYDHIKDASELAKIKGPYFPNMRRGDQVVRALFKITAPTNALRQINDNTWEFAGKQARKQAAAFAAAQDHMKPTVSSVWVDTNTGERYFNLGQLNEVRVKPQDVDSEQRFRVSIQNRYVEFFESKREAFEVAHELRNDPAVESVQDAVERRFQANDRQADMLSHQMQTLASSLERRPGYQNLSPNQQNQVVQTLNIASLRLLSQTRIQTKRLPRTNVLGASRDLTRNTLEYAQSVSGYLARLDHQDELNTAMREARAEADSSGDYGKGHGQSVLMKEMERRVARSTAFEERGRVNDWINRTLAVSFADKLISPAYNLLNSLQPIMMSYPALAARYGPGRAAVMLARVYKDIGVGQALKSGLVASKRTLMQGPSVVTPSILDDIRNNIKSSKERSMIDYLVSVGSIDVDAGIEISNMIETRTGVVGGLDQGINYLQTFGRQMPRSIEAINRTVTALAAYRLEMSRSGDHDASVKFAQETTNLTQGLYSHSNAAPIFNHPLGKISFQFKKYGQLVYGLIGHNIGKAIRNAEPGDRAEAVKTLAYMAATHVVMAGALGLPTEPLKWLMIGARQAGITELTWADVENYEREILASAFGQQLGEIAARGVSRALPEGFAFDMSSRVGLQDLFTFGEPRGADDQSLKAYMWDLVVGAPGSLAKDWFAGSQALMNGEWGEASEKFTPIKVVADAIKSYRQTSEGKKTAAGYVSMTPYGIGEAAIRTLGLTPAREAETTEARNYYYGATTRASAARNELMHQWVQASSSERGRLWGQVERFNRGKPRDERLTRKDLDAYVKRRRSEERGGLVQGGFRVTKRERNMYKKTMSIYGANP